METCLVCGDKKVGERCTQCDETRGLRTCRRCNILLPIELSFRQNSKVCRDCGKPGPISSMSAHDSELAVSLYNSGVGCYRIAKQLGRSPAGIRKHLMGKVSFRAADCNRNAIDQKFFETMDSEEKAYWLGFIVTDGNVHDTAIQIHIADKGHLEKFQQALRTSTKVVEYTKMSNGKLRTYYRIQFKSRAMVEDLSRLGVAPRKTFHVKPWIGPEWLMRHFWRGAMDGDGMVRRGRNSETGFCGNQYMVQGFIDFVRAQLGIRLKLKPHKSIWATHCYALPARQKIHSLLYGQCNVALDRKLATAQQLGLF